MCECPLRLDCKRLSFAMFEQSKADGGESMRIVWRILVWSFQALFAGTWPATDWTGAPWPANSAEARLAGRPLAEGFFGVPYIMKGDWEHFAKSFGLRRYSAGRPCDHCRCEKFHNSDPRDWPTNFRQDARWRTALITPTAWRAEYGADLHSLWQAFPFMSNWSIEPDEMHTIYMGTSCYMLGSVLHMLVFTILPGTPMQNMERVWEGICEQYRLLRVPTQYSSLGISSFVDPARPTLEYPRLKGRAAEVKWLAPVLLALWRRHGRPGVQVDQWVEACLTSQVRLQEIIDEEPAALFIEPALAAELPAVADRMLSFYSRLADAANRAGELLWTVAPKHHQLVHICARAAYLHPRRGSCFVDEDFMRRVKGIVQACTAATPLHRVPMTLLQKYRWGMCFQYVRASEE